MARKKETSSVTQLGPKTITGPSSTGGVITSTSKDVFSGGATPRGGTKGRKRSTLRDPGDVKTSSTQDNIPQSLGGRQALPDFKVTSDRVGGVDAFRISARDRTLPPISSTQKVDESGRLQFGDVVLSGQEFRDAGGKIDDADLGGAVTIQPSGKPFGVVDSLSRPGGKFNPLAQSFAFRKEASRRSLEDFGGQTAVDALSFSAEKGPLFSSFLTREGTLGGEGIKTSGRVASGFISEPIKDPFGSFVTFGAGLGLGAATGPVLKFAQPAIVNFPRATKVAKFGGGAIIGGGIVADLGITGFTQGSEAVGGKGFKLGAFGAGFGTGFTNPFGRLGPGGPSAKAFELSNKQLGKLSAAERNFGVGGRQRQAALDSAEVGFGKISNQFSDAGIRTNFRTQTGVESPILKTTFAGEGAGGEITQALRASVTPKNLGGGIDSLSAKAISRSLQSSDVKLISQTIKRPTVFREGEAFFDFGEVTSKSLGFLDQPKTTKFAQISEGFSEGGVSRTIGFRGRVSGRNELVDIKPFFGVSEKVDFGGLKGIGRVTLGGKVRAGARTTTRDVINVRIPELTTKVGQGGRVDTRGLAEFQPQFGKRGRTGTQDFFKPVFDDVSLKGFSGLPTSRVRFGSTRRPTGKIDRGIITAQQETGFGTVNLGSAFKIKRFSQVSGAKQIPLDSFEPSFFDFSPSKSIKGFDTGPSPRGGPSLKIIQKQTQQSLSGGLETFPSPIKDIRVSGGEGLPLSVGGTGLRGQIPFAGTGTFERTIGGAIPGGALQTRVDTTILGPTFTPSLPVSQSQIGFSQTGSGLKLPFIDTKVKSGADLFVGGKNLFDIGLKDNLQTSNLQSNLLDTGLKVSSGLRISQAQPQRIIQAQEFKLPDPIPPPPDTVETFDIPFDDFGGGDFFRPGRGKRFIPFPPLPFGAPIPSGRRKGKKIKRKFRRDPSFAASFFGDTATAPVFGEVSGLIERPLIVKRKRKSKGRKK